MSGFADFQRRVGEWAVRTFPEATARSHVAHLRREVEELDAALEGHGPFASVEEEAADCFILLLGVAHRCGFDLAAAAVHKQARNEARRWGQPDAEGVVEHIREGSDG